jgi:hypothetical protein
LGTLDHEEGLRLGLRQQAAPGVLLLLKNGLLTKMIIKLEGDDTRKLCVIQLSVSGRADPLIPIKTA